MRVYYMTSLTVAEIILRERRMKLSLFDELNDPFELQAVALDAAEVKHIVRTLREFYASTKGVLCFSDNWRSPVMWAHYADKHRGVCFGFHIPDGSDLLNQMHYNPERLKMTLDRSKPRWGIDEEFVKEFMHTKAHEWAYEREYRATAKLELRDPKTGFYYVNFGPTLQLREVILGCRCTLSLGKAAKLVGAEPSAVEVFRVRPAFKKFEIVRNLKRKPFFVAPTTGQGRV